MNKFFEKQNLTKLTEEVKNLSSSTSFTEFEFITKEHFAKKIPGPEAIAGEFYQHLENTYCQSYMNSWRKQRK